MRIMLTGAPLVASLAARGETPGQIVQAYADAAARLEPGFRVAASRGEALFRHRHRAVPVRLWRDDRVRSAANCAACHRGAADGRYSEHDLALPELQERPR